MTTTLPLIIRWLWLGVAMAAAIPALVFLTPLMALYSARWLQGFTPALALELLLFLQVALGAALFWQFSQGMRYVLLATAAGVALAMGYTGVLAAIPGVRTQWIFLVPAAGVAVGSGTTLAYGIVSKLSRRVRA
jgi:hypothetical protein